MHDDIDLRHMYIDGEVYKDNNIFLYAWTYVYMCTCMYIMYV